MLFQKQDQNHYHHHPHLYMFLFAVLFVGREITLHKFICWFIFAAFFPFIGRIHFPFSLDAFSPPRAATDRSTKYIILSTWIQFSLPPQESIDWIMDFISKQKRRRINKKTKSFLINSHCEIVINAAECRIKCQSTVIAFAFVWRASLRLVLNNVSRPSFASKLIIRCVVIWKAYGYAC